MIKIVDSIMGTGKTRWAISYMNANPQQRFIYVTPYLQEAERIVIGCPALNIKQPNDEITKQAGFNQLLKAGENMAISHELFTRLEWTQTVQERIREYGYTLILDEVLEVIKPVALSKADYQMLLETQKIGIAEDGQVLWLDPEYQGEFAHLKRMARSRTLVQTEDQALLWVMPVKALRSFSEMYVLTFMFKGSHMKHFLDMHDLDYQMAYVENDELHDGVQNLTKKKCEIRALLDVYEGPLNKLGDSKNAFSKSWWRKRYAKGTKPIKNNTYNYLNYICGAKSGTSMWSVFEEQKTACTPKGFAGGFCTCNARATNAYKDRKFLAYLLNVYENPEIVKWFAARGIKVDQEAFALSQLVQWIWRSAIRDGEPVRLYLPSARMRRILRSWLEDR